MNKERLEKYSSAITLSDMEVFVFPELAFSLVLANIISPVIWQWRKLDCFKKLEGKSNYKKLMRLKQFIMDEYDFNLDLETWGLTTKTKELKRFESVISPQELAASNALFGYEGDKYYFDVDIRRHFGLDKYDSEIIPYWKTETVEAMNAFRLKKGYKTGAGECVSLSTLYAAAAFVVCGIPLEDIFMILTPLHSQNFIDIEDGVLTNNRRLVTKTMWFNGTEISNKAQRALRNEQVTIIAHCTGYVHCLYKDATIDRRQYNRLSEKISSYLSAGIDLTMLANFLRANPAYQKYFQVCRDCHGQPQYLKAEVLFSYEHGSNYRIGECSIGKLLSEVLEEEFVPFPIAGRIRCDELENFLKAQKTNLEIPESRTVFEKYIASFIPNAAKFTNELADFLYVKAKLPDENKNHVSANPIRLDVDMSREQVIEYLHGLRKENITADLAFYAYRDMESCRWEPFVKAAVERCPVSVKMTESKSIKQVYQWLDQMKNDSIYEGRRLAQPDELANYRTGDGLEKAFLLANIIRSKNPDRAIRIIADKETITLKEQDEYRFTSAKGLQKEILITADGAIKIANG